MADTFPDFRNLGGNNNTNPSALSLNPWGRLYNFKTGHAELNENHKKWIKENLVPLFKAWGGSMFMQLWGYASKIGNAKFNDELSKKRAAEVKKYLASLVSSPAIKRPELSNMDRVMIGGYGTSHSGGGSHDNSPIFRGVDVWIYRMPDLKPPPPPKPPDVKPEPKMYFGFGAKGGGFLFVGGTQTVEAQLFSVDDYHDNFTGEGRAWNLGAGLGAGVNVVFCIASGITTPGQLVGSKFGGLDFNVSLGGRWGDALKGVKNAPIVLRIAQALKNSKMTVPILKGLTKLKVGDWEQMANLMKTIRDAKNSNPNAVKPQFDCFDVPLAGAALEVDAYYSWGSITSVY